MNFLTTKINKLLLALVIILLLTMSFGVVGFTLMDHSNMQTCLASAISGNDCSSVANNAIFLSHHIEVFQQFTQATVSYGIIILLLLMTAGVFLIQKLLHSPQKDFFQNKFIYILKKRLDLPFLPPNILRWIALLNKRGLSRIV